MIDYVAKLVDRTTYSEGRTSLSGGRRSRRPPRATEDQIEAWRSLVRAFAAAKAVQETALAGSQLDLSEYDVLVTLAEAPAEGIRPTELAERVLLTKSGMTRLVDRLGERGLIARHACPLDRRGHFIALTAEGRHHLRRAAPALLRGLGAVLAPLSPTELTALRRAAERMTEATSPHSAA